MTALFATASCPIFETLDVAKFSPGRVHRCAIRILSDPLGNPVCVPVMVARGSHEGPTVGITAAVHGNEVNGIPIIQRLFRRLEPRELTGSVVGIPVVTVPAFLDGRRTFAEGFDLNRLMPGNPNGNVGQVYAHRFLTRVLEQFDYLIDLHTASFGRMNSLYVRANMKHPIARKMAQLQCPEIIVHNEAGDGTLRGAAMERGIPAITVEAGDPLRFQSRLIRDSLHGLLGVLHHLGVTDEPEDPPDHETVVCARSIWIYAQHGGLLEVFPAPAQHVEKGQKIAHVKNVFGDVIASYHAPEDGIVVGRSSNPICETGSRILHLGVLGDVPENPR